MWVLNSVLTIVKSIQLAHQRGALFMDCKCITIGAQRGGLFNNGKSLHFLSIVLKQLVLPILTTR